MDTREVINKILEVAYKIAKKAVTRTEKTSLISRKCGSLKIPRYVIGPSYGKKEMLNELIFIEILLSFQNCRIFEGKQIRHICISEGCISLLQTMLTEAILYLMSSFDIQE